MMSCPEVLGFLRLDPGLVYIGFNETSTGLNYSKFPATNSYEGMILTDSLLLCLFAADS